MKGVLFDIQLGASGDMLLASLIDSGLDADQLMDQLKTINLDGWSFHPTKTTKYSIGGTIANINLVDNYHTSNKHCNRNLSNIETLIKESQLAPHVKDNIISVFTKLAQAEARVHNASISNIHFHEIGAADSIIDISAFCVAIDLIKIDKIYFNEFPFGKGTINIEHGEMPVPVPAVIEITKGLKSISCRGTGEMITPTAAAILCTLGTQIDDNLSFSINNFGIGFGTRDHERPSYTRAIMLDMDDHDTSIINELYCNIDDMNPEIYPFIIERLMENGALDAYIAPIIMKKGRIGSLLTVLCDTEKTNHIKHILYKETTTLGLRIKKVLREKIGRRFETIDLNGNRIRIKIGIYNSEIKNIEPEFDDCKAAALKTGIPLKDIMEESKKIYIKKTGK